MANRARGETGIRIGGKTFAIALNLDAMAAIETEFGSEFFEDVFSEIFGGEKIPAAKLRRLLIAVFESNGYAAEADCVGTLMPHDLNRIGIELLQNAFPDPGKSRKATGKNP